MRKGGITWTAVSRQFVKSSLTPAKHGERTDEQGQWCEDPTALAEGDDRGLYRVVSSSVLPSPSA